MSTPARYRNRARYRDRADAGRVLGAALTSYLGIPCPGIPHLDTPQLLVLGLPRGGVPVAAQVAAALGAPLDVVAVRKVGLPGQPELAAGALARIAGMVTTVRNGAVLAHWQRALAPGHDSRPVDQAFARAASAQLPELIRRDELYRGQLAPLEVRGRTVVVVDDGLATGATLRAALLGLREQNPARLVAAAPVSCGPISDPAVALATDLADDVVIPWQGSALAAVGEAYEKFDQTTDREVLRLLDNR